jgi:DNA adenine methylase
VSYFGGKSGPGVYHALINLMPPHAVYIEPFVGSGAVMRLKRPAHLNIGIDLDQACIARLRVAAGGIAKSGGSAGSREAAIPASIARAGDVRSPNAELGEACRRPSQKTAAAVIAEIGDVRSPNPESRDGGSGWEFRCEDGVSYLEANQPPKSALVYADPPYMLSTRKSPRSRYLHEMSDADHLRLLRCLRSLSCRVMISGYSSPLYAKELRGWNATAFQAATRGAPAAEWVWYNFDRPAELHDYRFLGETFRDRERIRRRQRGWAAKFRALPLLERRALLAALADET